VGVARIIRKRPIAVSPLPMTMPTDQGTPVPTSKIRNNVQRSVNALLDGLAPYVLR